MPTRRSSESRKSFTGAYAATCAGYWFGDVAGERIGSRRSTTSATVVALGHVRMRAEASGINLERPLAYVFEFEEGLARTARAYLDPQQALRAVGLRGQASASVRAASTREGAA
jgi:hypothetical protein